MPLFYYKARGKSNKKLASGTIEAKDQAEAIKKLRAKGLLILSVDTDRSLHFDLLKIVSRIKARDRILFIREFAVMMRAGMPILQALKAIKDQTENRMMQKTLGRLATEIEGGAALSTAFSHHNDVFPPIFVSVAKIGEKSGKLEEVLERLAVQLEKDDDLTSKIKGAMIYPAFVLSALVIVVILIMIFVIPQLKGLFEDVNVPLPLTTRILLGLSELFQKYLLVVLGVIVGIVLSLRYAAHHSPAMRQGLEQVRFRLPIFGNLYRKVLMARFSHTLGTLLASGLPMIEALKTTGEVMNSPTYQTSIKKITARISSGATLSENLLADRNFPKMIGHMTSIGENTGNISEVLETVAGFFDSEVENLTRNLSAALEPILMVVMGLGVAMVVSSVIGPIYNLVNAV